MPGYYGRHISTGVIGWSVTHVDALSNPLRFCNCCFFFFFQAEDGIRDLIVTGVQTCALPIFATLPLTVDGVRLERGEVGPVEGAWRAAADDDDVALVEPDPHRARDVARAQIGRASCRERV